MTHIRLKSDLIGGNEYGGLVFPIQFSHKRGSIGKITEELENGYLLTTLGDFAISPEMVASRGIKVRVIGEVTIEIHDAIIVEPEDGQADPNDVRVFSEIETSLEHSPKLSMIGFDKIRFEPID